MDNFVCAHGIECDVSQIYGWNSVVHRNPIDKSKKKEYCSIHDKMNTLEMEEILEAFGESGADYFDKDFIGAASKILAIAKTDNQDDEKLDGLSYAFSKLKDAQTRTEKEAHIDEVEMNDYSKLEKDTERNEALDNLKKNIFGEVKDDDGKGGEFINYLKKFASPSENNKK